MIQQIKCFAFLTSLLLPVSSLAMDDPGKLQTTGLFSISSTGLYNRNENLGLSSTHQQDIRLMLDGNTDTLSYEAHTIISTGQSSNITNTPYVFENYFQYHALKYNFINQENHSGFAKLDRLNIKANLKSIDMRFGRQAISWGTGRFWQPTDVFGAFNANELVRDYKPGIDVFDFNFYPDSFSNINFIYVFSKQNNSNAGLRYNRPVGSNSYLSLVAANIQDRNIIGGSLDSDWKRAGIRFESIYMSPTGNDNYSLFSIAGFDYQFSNEWILTSEAYFNKRGANKASEFSSVVSDTYFQAGLMKQISQQLLAVSLQNNVTPLISVNYLLISAVLTKDKLSASSLQQLSAVYSVSNESDIRVTILSRTGNKEDSSGIPQSEFGHIPLSLSFSFRIYM